MLTHACKWTALAHVAGDRAFCWIVCDYVLVCLASRSEFWLSGQRQRSNLIEVKSHRRASLSITSRRSHKFELHSTGTQGTFHARQHGNSTMPPKPPAKNGNTSAIGKEAVKLESVSQQAAPDAPMSGSNTPIVTPGGTPAPGTPAPRSGSARPSPAMRGRGGAKPQPKFAGRRSATARAELEAAEAKKKEAETKAAVEEAKRKAKEDRKFGYGRGRGGPRGGRGRGGHMSDRPREYASEAAGVFGGGRAVSDTKGLRSSRPVYPGSGGGGGGGGGGGSAGGGRSGAMGYYGGSGIKREGGDRDVEMGGVRPPMNAEDGLYISSDEDENEGVKRDIDQMQVIDLTGDNPPELENPFVPVRLSRVPHKERAVGLQAEDSPDSSDAADAISDKRRGKQRARDVEVTGTAAVPKRPTTYSSSDTEGEPQVKREPLDEEQTRPSAPEVGDLQSGVAITSPLDDMPSSPESKRKAKERIKATADATDVDGNESDIERPPEPHFQTQAEKDEWVRHYDDKQNIRHELGRLVPQDAPQPDAEGDSVMGEENGHLKRAQERQRLREEHVYLFQFPPILPDLKAISIKDETEAARPAGDAGDSMDVDHDNAHDPNTADTAKSALSTSSGLSLPSGQVGKLRVHASGKTTLDWGGTSLVLGLGAEATFLQNVLIATVPETKPKEGDKPPDQQEDGIGMGMGIIRAKFVLTPDWDEILK